MAYDTKAQEFGYALYARGWSKDKCLREMRKIYAGFAGSTWDSWLESLGWRERRAAADARAREFEDLAANAEKVLLIELDQIRKRLWEQVNRDGPDTQAVYAYNAIGKQIAELSRQHMASRDGGRLALDVLNRAFERFLTELKAETGLAKALAEYAPAVGRAVEKAAEEFGE